MKFPTDSGLFLRPAPLRETARARGRFATWTKAALALGLLGGAGRLQAQIVWAGTGNSTLGVADSSNWVGNVTPNSGADIAFNLSAPPTVNIPLSFTVGNITFNDTGSPVRPAYTLFGQNSAVLTINGNLTVQAGGSVTADSSLGISIPSGAHTASVASGVTIFAKSNVTGAGSITLAGGGTLALSGTNTYSGGTTLSAGTLDINSATALGTGRLTIAGGTIDNTSGSAITLSTNNAQTWSGDFVFTGSNSLNLGTGAVSLSGSRSVTVNATTLTVGGAIGDGPATYGLTKAGTGTLVLSANNTYGGTTTVSAGTLQLGTGGKTGSLSNGAISIQNNGTLALDSSSDITLSGAISGSGTITKLTDDTLTLSGNNGSFSGSLTSGGNGTVSLSGTNSRGTGTWAFSGNSVLEVDATGSNSGNGVLRAGTTTFSSTASLLAQNSFAISGGNQNFSDAAVLTASASNVITGGNQTFTSSTNPLGKTAFTVAAYTSLDDDTIGDDLKSTSRLTVDRNSGNNTITGGTQTFSGYSSLQANHSAAIANGSTQIFNDNSNLRASKTDAVAGGSQTFNGNSFLWVKTTDDGPGVSGGTQTFNDSSSLVAATTNAVIGGTQIFNGSSVAYANATNSINGVDLTLNSNSFISIGATNALSATTDINFNGGALILNGYNTTVGAISSGSATNSGLIENSSSNAATLTVGDGTNTTFSGVITDGAFSNISGGELGGHSSLFVGAPGSLSLVKTGAGHLYLSGTNTYTGGTTINAGYLVLGNNTTTGSITGDVAFTGNTALGGGELQFYRSNAYLFNGNITGPGRVSDFGNGAITLTGINTYSGDTFVNAGTLGDSGASPSLSPNSVIHVNTGAALNVNSNESIAGLDDYTPGVSGHVVLSSGITLTSANPSPQTFSGVISGSGSLAKNNSGTFTLSGLNTYTGNTTVAGGTLQLGLDNALPSSTDVNLPFGQATLDLNNHNDTVGSIAGVLFSAITLGSGTLTLADNNSTTFAGNITGTGSLIKNGTGTLTLGGASTYSGGTTVNAGTLKISSSGSLSGAGDVTLNGSAVLDVFATNQSIRDLSSSSTASTVLIESGASLKADMPSTTSIFAGTIDGAGTLLKSNGNGTLILTGNVTSTVSTTVSSGVLQVGNGGTTGSIAGNLTVNSGGTVDLNRSDAPTNPIIYSSALSGSGAIVKDGPSTLILSGNANTFGGSLSIDNGNVILSGSNTGPNLHVDIAADSLFSVQNNLTVFQLTGPGTAQIAANKTLLVNGGTTLSAVVTGAGSLQKNDPGTLTVTSVNTYTGNTIIGGGTLLVSTPNALPTVTNVILNPNTTLDLGASQTIAGFASSVVNSLVKIESGRTFDVTLGSALFGTGFSGAITDGASPGGALEIGPSTDGGGHTVGLFGTNTYTGGTTIDSGGKLLLGNNTSTGSIVGNVADSGLLIFNRGDSMTFSGVISGSGGVSQGVTAGTTTGTTLLTAANTYTGGTNVYGGGLLANNLSGSATGTGAVTVNTPTSPPITIANISTINNPPVFGGNGTITGALTINPGGALVPGGDGVVGTLTVANNVTLLGGSAIGFDFSATVGTPGQQWDLLSISAGQLIIDASATKFPIFVSPDPVGALASGGLDLTKSYSWQFVSTTGGITGFSPTVFTFDPSLASFGTFSVSLGNSFTGGTNNGLFLNFSPLAVPEPSTWALLATGLGVFGFLALRRRKQP